MNKIIRYLYAAMLVVCLTSMFAAVAVIRALPAAPELKVQFLDVGQGDAIFIETPEHAQILIDAGPDASVVQELGSVMPWWDKTIDYVLMTHADLDHYGGLPSVLKSYRVREFLWNGTDDASARFQDLRSDLEAASVRLRVLSQGEAIRWPSGVALRALWPPQHYDAEKNARSLVTLLSFHDTDILLTGDLPLEQEALMLEQYPSLTAEILKTGHHGSRSSSGSEFLHQIRPLFCIISAGTDNRYGHPHPEALSRLHDTGCTIRSTLEQGRVSFTTDGTHITAVSGAFGL